MIILFNNNLASYVIKTHLWIDWVYTLVVIIIKKLIIFVFTLAICLEDSLLFVIEVDKKREKQTPHVGITSITGHIIEGWVLA